MTCIKTYMLVPHHDFPADGPIKLGSIILEPREPGESLNEAEIPEIPTTSKHSSHKYNWEQTVDSMRNGSAGVWARCVNILGLGGSLGMSFDTVTVDHYKFEELETTYFAPSQVYIEEAVTMPKIRQFLEGARYTPVYMITGLKIVRGPGSQVISRKTIAQGGQANFGLPGITGAGRAAVDAGDLSYRQGGTTNTSFSGSSDFVIGYRLGKITFQRSAQGTQIPKHQREVAGAVLGLFEDRAKQDPRFLPVEVIFDGEEGIAQDLEGRHLVAVGAIDEEDDTDCQCFIVPLAGTNNN